MAETKSTKTTAKTSTTRKSTSNCTKDDLVKMNQDLQESNAQLQKQMQEMMENMKILMAEKTEIEKKNEEMQESLDSASESEYTDINPLKPIKIVSLTDGTVVLKTQPSGGKEFTIDKFGSAITVTYQDLQNIIINDRSFIEDGAVFICDKDVVNNNYLDEYYNNFLTLDTIKNILSFDIDHVTDMVANTTESIQESIISLLVKKINNNEYVDMNKVSAIGRVCKKPCDILRLAMDMRSVDESVK